MDGDRKIASKGVSQASTNFTPNFFPAVGESDFGREEDNDLKDFYFNELWNSTLDIIGNVFKHVSYPGTELIYPADLFKKPGNRGIFWRRGELRDRPGFSQ